MGENQLNLLEKTKILLKSMVTSSAIPVTIKMLQSDYKYREGENIPYSRLGYRDLKTFLRSIPDTLIVNSRTEIVQVVNSQNSASQHVLKLVSEQKVKNRRNHKNSGIRQDWRKTHTDESNNNKQHIRRSQQQYPTPTPIPNSTPNFRPGRFTAPPNTFFIGPSYSKSFHDANNRNGNPMHHSNQNFQPGILLAPPSALFNVPMYPNSFRTADRIIAQQNRVAGSHSISEFENSSASSGSNAKQSKNGNYDVKKDNLIQEMSTLDINSLDQQQQQQQNGGPRLTSKQNLLSTKAVSKQELVDDLSNAESLSQSNLSSEIAVPNLSDDDSIHLIGTGYSNSKYGKKIPPSILPDTLSGKDVHKIYISEIASPWRFWFHLIDEKHSLEILQNNLNTTYRSDSHDMAISPSLMKVGYACVAYHSQQWMRAEFIAKPNDDTVKLLFVDFGTVADVPIENILFLVSNLCSIPRQCYRGALHSIKPNNENEMEKATLMFCKIVRNKPLFGIVTNIDNDNTIDIIIVDTSLPNEDIIVNQHLTKTIFSDGDPQKC